MSKNKPLAPATSFNRSTNMYERQSVKLICDPSQDQARQEHKKDTDINTILRKHGGDLRGLTRPTNYGEQDFNLTLQNAIATTDRVAAAWANIPADIRKKYPDWHSVQRAIAAKQLEIKGGKLQFVPPPEPPPKTDK